MISFDAMKTELKARLGNRTDLDARMGRWINYAFFELTMNPRFSFYELDMRDSFTTVAVQDVYPIPADLWFVLDMRDDFNERKLRHSHWSYVDKFSRITGQPVRYFRFKNDLVLDPIPDAAYIIRRRYRKRPPDLIPGTTYEGLGTEWEEPILTMATIKAWEALKQPDYAAAQRQLLEGMLGGRDDVPGLDDLDSETGVEVALRPRL